MRKVQGNVITSVSNGKDKMEGFNFVLNNRTTALRSSMLTTENLIL